MREVILYIALSLDGYIADESGSVGWLGGSDEEYESDEGYERFLQTVDTVVMGYNTYHQIVTELSPDKWPYPQLESYIFTHRQTADDGNIHFVDQPVAQWLKLLKNLPGKNIWICGGAQLVKQCMEAKLIDRYHLTIIPVILGNGIPLFPSGTRPAQLELVSLQAENGAAQCIYRNKADVD